MTNINNFSHAPFDHHRVTLEIPTQTKARAFDSVFTTYRINHRALGLPFGGTDLDSHVHCHHQHGDEHVWDRFSDSFLDVCVVGSWERCSKVRRMHSRRWALGNNISRNTHTQTDPVNLVHVRQEVCPLFFGTSVVHCWEHPTLHNYGTASCEVAVRE